MRTLVCVRAVELLRREKQVWMPKSATKQRTSAEAAQEQQVMGPEVKVVGLVIFAGSVSVILFLSLKLS
eukprot:139962-Amphidinium_carterae.1